ncbi:MAG: archease [Gammaproteobacteria bacterium]|nr:archease [Gammaproteobacteria bacterium]MCW8959022.1 archease [Gammaproteobacteria bacterium]MCW8972279.1 archease [Gammaproteobacteria bacterium]MCW8991874.1 archease [Gammaproteobacteria bacterium]
MSGDRAWSHFRHQADVGICGEGATPEQAFANAAIAMTAVITAPQRVRPEQPVSLHCTAPDLELLLVDFLNAIVYEMATRHMLFSRFDLSIRDGRLDAIAWGEALDPQRHQPAVEVKGASYTELEVSHENGHWTARCVVDV